MTNKSTNLLAKLICCIFTTYLKNIDIKELFQFFYNYYSVILAPIHMNNLNKGVNYE